MPEGGRGGAAEGRRGRAGADFSPVASGLRQFGFLPRLESRRQAFQKSQNRNRAGLHTAARKRRPSSSPSRCRCGPRIGCSPESLVPGSSQVNLPGVLQHLGQSTQKTWLLSLPAAWNSVSKLLNLGLWLGSGLCCALLATGC